MTGTFQSAGGEALPLPEFTAWRLIHTDGHGADSFSVTFPTQPGLLPRLMRGAGFLAGDGEKTAFRGVTDEVEAVWADAFTTTLVGRGLAAKLMDNQADGAQYFHLDLDTVLDRYVRPFGVTQIRTAGGPWRTQMLAVSPGTSCMRVLQGFCRHAGAPMPRFTPDGTLWIGPPTGTHRLSEADVLSARWRLCRYGVVTGQYVHDLTTGRTSHAEEASLRGYDVASVRYATRSGPFTNIIERSAAQRVAEAKRDFLTLELTLPGTFAAQCCDAVQVSLPALRVAGEFAITEICRRFDGRCETTRLRLRAKEQ